jgi:inhibitor of KinA sporulation pathway (predicted exonuclease)
MNKDNFVILDIETNVEKDIPIEKHFHVIQIGATKITSGEYCNYSTFNHYIKTQNIVEHPEVGTKLTDFIKELTKITQEQVDSAETFPEVWNKFLVFSAPYFEFFASWGGYDWTLLKRNCYHYSLPFPFRYHVNLKDYYKAIFKNEEVALGTGVKAASKFFELPFNEEVAHNGMEDARMITAIAKAMADKEFYTFKKSLYEFGEGDLLKPSKVAALLHNPVLVREYNKMQKRLTEIKDFLFQDRFETD